MASKATRRTILVLHVAFASARADGGTAGVEEQVAAIQDGRAAQLEAMREEFIAERAAARSRVASLEMRLATLERQRAETAAAMEQAHPPQGPIGSPRAMKANSLATVAETVAGLSTALDHAWLILCGALVMFMQAGFAILTSGTCRFKNGGMILLKNLIDATVGAIVWNILGYGLAYGVDQDPNKFIGTKAFAGSEFEGTVHFRDWFFQWTFCATAVTIVSGAVAERIQFHAYVLYAAVMTGFIYPVIVYWTWSGAGFLSVDYLYDDFAGSGIVHLTGGTGALVGAVVVGPRAGRWNGDAAESFQPHNLAHVVLGTFFLWFGFYGFNCGSTLGLSSSSQAMQAASVAMNTTLSAAAGALTALLLRLRFKTLDLAFMCNGLLAGLVAVCAGVAVMDSGFAMLTGILGALAMEGGHTLMLLLKIDDPLDAFAVHGCAGIVGLVVRALFDIDDEEGKGKRLGGMLLGALCIMAWTAALSAMVFVPLRVAKLLRVSDEEQERGGDTSELAQTKVFQVDDIKPIAGHNVEV